MIMSISKLTVEKHLLNARMKLQAVRKPWRKRSGAS